MIQFDFANPYLIYVMYVSFTFFSIYALFKWHEVFRRHRKLVYTVAFVALLYAQFARYAIPYLEGRPTLPFYITRIASIAALIYLAIGKRSWDGFIFFLSVNNFWPVLIPNGPIETIRILDESFFIDHYVASLLAVYILTARDYIPKMRDLLMASGLLGTFIISFAFINPLMGWGYFFMNEHNPLFDLFSWMTFLIFALLLTAGVVLFQFIMFVVGRKYHEKRA